MKMRTVFNRTVELTPLDGSIFSLVADGRDVDIIHVSFVYKKAKEAELKFFKEHSLVDAEYVSTMGCPKKDSNDRKEALKSIKAWALAQSK